VVAGASPGDEVTIVGIRDGKRFETTVIATERSGYAEQR
jgi:aspartate 1-decarboxylase